MNLLQCPVQVCVLQRLLAGRAMAAGYVDTRPELMEEVGLVSPCFCL